MTQQSTYKPAGHPDVCVYILASDATGLMAFLKTVFDATELMNLTRPDGSVQHAELGIGDSVVMLAQEMEGYPAVPAWLHLYVEDVDATYRSALDAGATSVQAPKRGEDPDRRGGIRDPAGNVWWIATRQE